jgi:hypothetical protein
VKRKALCGVEMWREVARFFLQIPAQIQVQVQVSKRESSRAETPTIKLPPAFAMVVPVAVLRRRRQANAQRRWIASQPNCGDGGDSAAQRGG